ncbi:MAG: ABC transporter substrate-binding protein, partial [Clostridium sp.]|nr:ABC transporter substrate-binding protein [Clostridium sp.]
MIASKKIDACVGLAGSLIPQVDSGLDISFTTGLHTGCTKYYAAADSDINDMSDLKGKKIGVPGMSDSSVVTLKRILHDLEIGVSQDNMEIELVVYNLTDLPLALANGAVDAVALHDPVAASAESEYGFKKLFDTTTDGKFSNRPLAKLREQLEITNTCNHGFFTAFALTAFLLNKVIYG